MDNSRQKLIFEGIRRLVNQVRLSSDSISTSRLCVSVPLNLLYKCRESSTNRPCFFKTKPISVQPKMSVSSVFTKDYENQPAFGVAKSKAKQTQFQNPVWFKMGKNERESIVSLGNFAHHEVSSVIVFEPKAEIARLRQPDGLLDDGLQAGPVRRETPASINSARSSRAILNLTLFCSLHKLIHPVFKEQGVQMQFFACQSDAFSRQPRFQLILVMGKLLGDSLFVQPSQHSQSLLLGLLGLAGCSEKAAYLIHSYGPALPEIGNEPPRDFVRKHEFFVQPRGLNFARFIMKKRIIEEHGRMVIYSVGGQMWNENI